MTKDLELRAGEVLQEGAPFAEIDDLASWQLHAEINERDIAAVIGRQPGTVKSRLNAARSRLAVHPALQSEGPSPINARKERHS